MKTDPTLRPLKPLFKVLYFVVFTIAQVLVRLVYPVRALGKENLPAYTPGEPGFVVAPNHISAIDPLFLLMARGWRRKMIIMGKAELFGKNKLLDFFWALAGAFAIDRGAGDRAVVEDAMREVRAGRDLLIYPEGTRSKNGRLGRIKSGAFVVAQEAGADIIPVLTWYKAGQLKAFNRCTIVFGKPIDMSGLERNAKALRAAKEQYKQALADLHEEYTGRL